MTSTKTMVETQIVARGIRDPGVLAAMRAVPRERFVPRALRWLAFADQPLPLSEGQTISQPCVVASMTEALRLRPSDRVLEVGTGCGYQTAVLAEIAKEVYSIEILPKLALQAAELLRELGYRNLHLRVGDGRQGWAEAAPFDAVIVTAAAESIPPNLFEQLAPGGRMVIPVGPAALVQDLMLVEKSEDGSLRTKSLAPVRFVPLVY